MYGFHPGEDYSRDVALALAELSLEGITVREFVPRRRNFHLFLGPNRADWALDLHSHHREHLVPPDDELLRSSYLGTISWGWKHDYNQVVKNFFDEGYDGKEVLSYGPSGTYRRMHAGCFILGLLWYRPFEQSFELVKKLTNYLKRTSP